MFKINYLCKMLFAGIANLLGLGKKDNKNTKAKEVIDMSKSAPDVKAQTMQAMPLPGPFDK